MSSLFTGGRLSRPNPRLVSFTSSLESDARIAEATVQVNEAHVLALEKIGVLSRNEAKKTLASLRRLEKHPPSRRGVEDVHLLIEEEVRRQVGAQIGGKEHRVLVRGLHSPPARPTRNIRALPTCPN